MIYQIGYNQESKRKVEFNLYDTEGITLHNYENDVILDVWKNHRSEWENEKYVGIFSWRFKEKTGLSASQVLAILDTQDTDIISFFPMDYERHPHPYSRSGYNSVIEQCVAVDKSGIFPFKLHRYPIKENVWCNYWVAKPHIFDEYCREVLEPSIDYLKTTPLYERRESHRKQRYLSMTFFLEGLFSIYAQESQVSHYIEKNKNKQHNNMKTSIITFEDYDPVLITDRSGEVEKQMRLLGLVYNHPYTITSFAYRQDAIEWLEKHRLIDGNAYEYHSTSQKIEEIQSPSVELLKEDKLTKEQKSTKNGKNTKPANASNTDRLQHGDHIPLVTLSATTEETEA